MYPIIWIYSIQRQTISITQKFSTQLVTIIKVDTMWDGYCVYYDPGVSLLEFPEPGHSHTQHLTAPNTDRWKSYTMNPCCLWIIVRPHVMNILLFYIFAINSQTTVITIKVSASYDLQFNHNMPQFKTQRMCLQLYWNPLLCYNLKCLI